MRQHFDDNMIEKYVGDEEITADDLRHALRTGTIAAHIVPVLCGSAFKNKGVQPLLDAVVDYLPRPLDIAATPRARPPKGEEIEPRAPSDDAALLPPSPSRS